jgi:hypothetical protein
MGHALTCSSPAIRQYGCAAGARLLPRLPAPVVRRRARRCSQPAAKRPAAAPSRARASPIPVRSRAERRAHQCRPRRGTACSRRGDWEYGWRRRCRWLVCSGRWRRRQRAARGALSARRPMYDRRRAPRPLPKRGPIRALGAARAPQRSRRCRRAAPREPWLVRSDGQPRRALARRTGVPLPIRRRASWGARLIQCPSCHCN